MWRALALQSTSLRLYDTTTRGLRTRLTPISKLPLKALYVQQLRKDLAESAGIFVVQAANWNEREYAAARSKLKRQKVIVRHVKNTLMRLALEETSWRSLMPVFVGPNDVIFISNADQAPVVSRTLLGLPDCLVTAASLGDTLLDLQDIKQLAKIEDKTQVFVGSLCFVLT